MYVYVWAFIEHICRTSEKCCDHADVHMCSLREFFIKNPTSSLCCIKVANHSTGKLELEMCLTVVRYYVAHESTSITWLQILLAINAILCVMAIYGAIYWSNDALGLCLIALSICKYLAVYTVPLKTSLWGVALMQL